MSWLGADPVTEIDNLILRHREDQRAWQVQLEDAVTAEVRAMGALDATRDIQVRCREAIAADTAEIDRLFEERDRLIPRSRRPVE